MLALLVLGLCAPVIDSAEGPDTESNREAVREYLRREIRRSPPLYSLSARLAAARHSGGRMLQDELVRLSHELEPDALVRQGVVSHDGPKVPCRITSDVALRPGQTVTVHLLASEGWHTTRRQLSLPADDN